jgi:hypothetical protein
MLIIIGEVAQSWETEMDLLVKLRARDWAMGGGAIAWLRENPPGGYRVEFAQLLPSTSSGRRCDLTVGLNYVDDREIELNHVRARGNSSLVIFSAMAQGRATIPSIDPTDSTSTHGSASEEPSPEE